MSAAIAEYFAGASLLFPGFQHHPTGRPSLVRDSDRSDSPSCFEAANGFSQIVHIVQSVAVRGG